MATGLEKLNDLLKREDLGIPEFRKQVDKTGRNLNWIRRAVAHNNSASDALKELVAQEMPQLSKEITA